MADGEADSRKLTALGPRWVLFGSKGWMDATKNNDLPSSSPSIINVAFYTNAPRLQNLRLLKNRVPCFTGLDQTPSNILYKYTTGNELQVLDRVRQLRGEASRTIPSPLRPPENNIDYSMSVPNHFVEMQIEE